MAMAPFSNSPHPEKMATYEADARLASIDAFLEAMTLPIPTELPIQCTKQRTEFYARESYGKCYDHILELLLSKASQCVTVTGTLGVGKSMFLVYCFLRYRLENPAAGVQVEAYDRDSTKLHSGDIDGDVITLVDGIPSSPPASNRWICFASPNVSREDKMKNEHGHVELFLPIWDLDELQVAADRLGLDELLEPMTKEETAMCGTTIEAGPEYNSDGEDTIETRTFIFGFLPNTCLELDRSVLRAQFERLNAAIATVGHAKLQPLLWGDKSHQEQCDIVRHYFIPPTSSTLDKYHVAIASNYTRRMLVENIVKMTMDERVYLEKKLLEHEEVEDIAQLVFKQRVFEMFARGGTFQFHRLY
ncbi:hypothetical protein Poli38472_013044 [Pythium oligandrum]|uniref:Uncharacterized protein n=1 Tax=Pythium oligandrum TaxID=41045 RepID=A0A8K1CLD0_PYTOL|nr:hypothetical protein Poli38472_013044 [Pythium oligandrum]|eukprot:TMW64422.1 hypothetical protein Poli38472_013044 [Pythium oligandrum]